ncbi:MAG: ABC transporter ATP-binding protein [Lachnospiraceae bacterium]
MEPCIYGKGISYQYKNAKCKQLKNLDFTIGQGECIVLCGKSGSGKTTLTRILNGLSPDFYPGELEGSGECLGLKLGEERIEAYVPLVGSVFQNPKTQYFNVDTTAELAFPCENMGLEPEAIRTRVAEKAKEFSVEHLLDKSIFHLSGGEKQRIAFAASCMLNPRLLVLDEPTSNLDKKAIEDIKQLIIKEKEKGTTILIAEHRLAWTLAFADRYLYFEDGICKEEWSKAAFCRLPDNELKRRGLRAAYLENVCEAVEEKTQIRCEKALLEMEELNVGYQKNKAIYRMEHFRIGNGEIVGIMGHNGIGKSTFAKTLCGLLKPVSGKILWQGKAIRSRELLKKSFMVMQDVNYQLFSDSVREEVLLGTKEGTDCEAVLETLGLLEYAQAHPMSLSGGQKQRVAIASAILADKELIILDEPTSGLDRFHMEQVGKLLQGLKEKGKAILVITHDEELAAGWCDRVVKLNA